MGNKPSVGGVPYNIQNFEMVNVPSTQHDCEQEDKAEKSVFKIFHVLQNRENDFNTKPLAEVSTKDHNPNFQIAISSLQELNTSGDHELEDTVFIQEFEKDGEKLFFASVLDGHMGMDISHTVVGNLFGLIADRLFQYPENITQEITSSFNEIDRLCCEEKARQLLLISQSRKSCLPCLAVRESVSHENLYLGCGCVLTFLCVQNNQLILVGLGDCGVCFSIGGRAEYSLPRHDLRNPLEEQRVKSAGARIEDNRINGMLEVTRSFGDVWFKPSYHTKKKDGDRAQDTVLSDPVIEIHPLSNDVEFCILGSDGLFSVMSCQQAVNIVKETILSGRSGEEACKELIRKCRQKTSDDISVVLLFFHIPTHTQSSDQ